jgi:hypothetical protein
MGYRSKALTQSLRFNALPCVFCGFATTKKGSAEI